MEKTEERGSKTGKIYTEEKVERLEKTSVKSKRVGDGWLKNRRRKELQKVRKKEREGDRERDRKREKIFSFSIFQM